MKTITNKEMVRRAIQIDLGLGDYTDLVENVISTIKSEPALLSADIRTAVELCMLDFEVENASFYDVLKPFYTENYDLIPIIGIDGVMNLAVQDFLTEKIAENEVLDIIGRTLAFDYMHSMAKDNVKYSVDIIEFVNSIIPTAYYDINEMLEDVVIGLEITEVKEKKSSCKKKKVSSSPQIRVIVLDNSDIANDIFALLNLINGGK